MYDNDDDTSVNVYGTVIMVTATARFHLNEKSAQDSCQPADRAK